MTKTDEGLVVKVNFTAFSSGSTESLPAEQVLIAEQKERTWNRSLRYYRSETFFVPLDLFGL